MILLIVVVGVLAGGSGSNSGSHTVSASGCPNQQVGSQTVTYHKVNGQCVADFTPVPSMPDAPTTEETTTTTTNDIFPMGAKVPMTSGASLQVFSWTQPVSSSNQFETPDPGNEYGVVDIQVCAGSDSASYNDLAVYAQTADNRTWRAAFAETRQPDFGSGDLPAGGGCRRGYVTVQVPKGQRPVYIIWDYGGWPRIRWQL